MTRSQFRLQMADTVGWVASHWAANASRVPDDNINNREIPSAPYILERRHYFDRKGVPLRKLDKAFASKGQQEFPVSFVYPIDFEIYKSVDELPFAAKK